MGIFSRIGQGLKKFGDVSETVLEAGTETFIDPVGRAALTPFATAFKPRKGFKHTPFGEVKPMDVLQREGSLKPGEAVGLAAETILSGPGGTLTKAAKPIAKPFGKVLAKIGKAQGAGALSDVERALKPTTQKLKALTKKIAPEFLEQGIKGTQEDIIKQAKAGIEIANKKFDELGKLKGVISTKPVLDAFEKAKDAYIIEGKIINKRAIATIDEIAETVSQFGEEMPSEAMRALKTLWSREVAEAGGFFGKTLKEGSQLRIKELGAKSIRNALAEQFPDVAKVNKEVTFFRRLEEIAEATRLRRTGQSGLFRKGAGAAVGAQIGAPLGAQAAGAGAVIGSNVGKFLGTPLFRSYSAQIRKRVADVLIDGTHNIEKVADFMKKPAFATLKLKDFNQFLKSEKAKKTQEEVQQEEAAKAQRIDEILQRISEGEPTAPEPVPTPETILSGRSDDEQEKIMEILNRMKQK